MIKEKEDLEKTDPLEIIERTKQSIEVLLNIKSDGSQTEETSYEVPLGEEDNLVDKSNILEDLSANFLNDSKDKSASLTIENLAKSTHEKFMDKSIEESEIKVPEKKFASVLSK